MNILFISAVLCTLFINSAFGQATMTLAATTRDQSPRKFANIDFEWMNFGKLETGIVQNGLDQTLRKPVYCCGDGLSPLGTVHNQTTFNTWFQDSNKTVNVLQNLTLSNAGQSSPNVYYYYSAAYFPINYKGWDIGGHDEYIDLAGNYQNFHFCNEAHGRFSYKGGETFAFLGDDDVWAFINNQLAMDIGGVHGPISGSFALDTIATEFGLTTGNNYRFDFFWCERHTLGSDIKITTTLEIYCSYYDWCDQCDGDGQSCCPVGACNDNDACTEDLCAVLVPPTVSCQNIPINCTAANICVTSTCSMVNGSCLVAPVVCPSDGNECTIESCSTTQGGCISTNVTCNGGNGKCTTAACNPATGLCSYANVSCDDANPCTIDTCSATAGCQHSTLLCNDNNACTTDTCSTSTGCVYTPIDCNDNNACTNDTCSGGQCSHLTLTCNDGNACTVDSCSTTTGCINTVPTSCNDNNACTDDSCSPTSGCIHNPTNCDDSNACTADSCSISTGCAHANISCDDGNDCTFDACDITNGCSHTPKDCDDNNACTVDACGASNDPTNAQYCTHTPLNCNDNNACTNDSCSTSSGCTYQPVSCVTNDPCQQDSCSTSTGCVITTLPPSQCTACGTASTSFFACPTTDLCHPQKCFVNSTGGPQCGFPANVTCNDNNACTSDSCTASSGQCVFTPIPCVAPNSCSTAACNITTGKCVITPINCNDGNNCTTDTCTNGVCSNTLTNDGCVPCGTGSCLTTNFCNPLICSSTVGAGTCTQTSVSCNDSNACTTDTCSTVSAWNTTCTHTPVSCTSLFPNANGCSPLSCDIIKGCQVGNVSCDDSNPCTVDSCSSTGLTTSNCVHTPVCSSTDPCNPSVCSTSTGACSVVPVDCDDNNNCTADSCAVSSGLATCVNAQKNCTVVDLCQPANCDSVTGACVVTPVNCDDGILCTLDSCLAGICSHVLNPCLDNSNCTVDSCNNTAGTIDGCQHSPLVCASNLCATATCDIHLGCVMTPVNCTEQGVNSTDLVGGTNWCLGHSCDESVGCINVTRTCLLSQELSDPAHWVDPDPNNWIGTGSSRHKNEDCYSATCDLGIQKCVITRREPWGNCGFIYLNTGKQAAILTAGALAGVIIGAVIFAALAGFGAKKGYDAWVRMADEKFSGAATNPLYKESSGKGTNPLFA